MLGRKQNVLKWPNKPERVLKYLDLAVELAVEILKSLDYAFQQTSKYSAASGTTNNKEHLPDKPNLRLQNLYLRKSLEFYRKANIPMISYKMACKKIITLADDNAKLRSIPVACRTKPFVLNKLKCMEIELNKTFQTWPANVTKLVTLPEDLQFLESMKTDRLASFGSRDIVLSNKLKRKAARNADLMARQAKACQQLNEASAGTETFSPSEPSSSKNESASSDNEYATSTGATPSSHHRTHRTGEHVFIPHDILKIAQACCADQYVDETIPCSTVCSLHPDSHWRGWWWPD